MSARTATDFTVLIPARLASTRLPDKPLADIGGAPMVVRVAQAAARSGARQVVVACDDVRIQQACAVHGVQAVLTGVHHLSGSDRLAQTCELLGLADDEVVVNVQGDEPLIQPSLIDAVARLLHSACPAGLQASMGTAAHPLDDSTDPHSPHVVKVVLDAFGHALYFSRSPIPFHRQRGANDSPLLRHVGLYSYRVGFLRQFTQLAPAPIEQAESLEQLRAIWHGHRIAVHVCGETPAPGVDTPQDLERARALWLAQAP